MTNARLVSCGTARFRRDAVVPPCAVRIFVIFATPSNSIDWHYHNHKLDIVESKHCVFHYISSFTFGNYEYTFAFPHENPFCIILLTP